MFSLIKIEWLKIRKYPAFWWMVGIIALTYPGVNMMFHGIYVQMTTGKNQAAQMMKMFIGNPFAFPEVWHSTTYFSSWFLIVPAILVIMLVANEYTYKTNRQNIIDGWSRNQFVWSKLFDVAIVALVTTIIAAIVSAIFGINYSTATEVSQWNQQLKYIPLFLLQTFSQLSIAFLAGFVMRRSFIALGVFLFYFIILEPAAVAIIKKFSGIPAIADFMPLEVSDKLIPPASFIGRFDKDAYNEALAQVNIHVLYTCIFTAALWWLCFYIYRKRDL
jgi:ABC-type transport system involved in multi-copper enzyme maturation permease subunit